MNQKYEFNLTVDFKDKKLIFLDQTLLPVQEKELRISDYRKFIDAIKRLAIRGAPAIGVSGAFGVVIAAYNTRREEKTYSGFINLLRQRCDEIRQARPTAVNLPWAVNRQLNEMKKYEKETSEEKRNINDVIDLLEKSAKTIQQEDLKIGMELGQRGASLIKDGDVILTHCNAGGLATAGMGSALSIFYYAHKAGKKFTVYVDETRPLLQGARLTTWELKKWGINYKLICDNMAGALMKQKIIKKVLTGADRIALNGDSANKIGTYAVAALANFHKIPFYIAAPYSTFDPNAKSEKDIPIEYRNEDELRFFQGKQIAPLDAPGLNPAFDVVPASLIKGIITEKKIIKSPDRQGVKKFLSLYKSGK